MSEVRVILATTETRIDGVQFTVEQLLELAQEIDTTGKGDHDKWRSGTVKLPFMQGYPHCRQMSWVGYPEPGGPAVLYVQGHVEPSAVWKRYVGGVEHMLVAAFVPMPAAKED